MPRRDRAVLRRRPLPAAAALLAVACLAFASSFAASGPDRDRGRSPAHRVVALAPNLTEIVFAIGTESALVGVSDFSDYPPAAAALPKVGGLDPSAERVASLRPDLVLATAEGGNRKGAVTSLEAVGIPVLLVPGGSLDDVLSGIRLVGARLGVSERAAKVAAALEERRRAVRARRRSDPLRAVLLVWPEPPQAAGGGTFLDDVLTEAGARNLLGDRKGWPVISAEWLATAPIDVLVVPDSPENRPAYDRAFATGALSRGTAAKARVIRIPESPLTRPGPRVFDALEELARELAK